MKAKFLVIIENGENNYSAYSPNVPGCAATDESVESTLEHIRDALEFHFEGMLQNGEEIPEPKSLSYYLQQPGEISSDDIRAHLDIEVPELTPA